MPSFNIHYSSWWSEYLLLIKRRWLLLVLDLWAFSILRNPVFVLCLSFSLNQKRAESSSFLCRSEIIFQQFIEELITYPNFLLQILEIWFLSSLLFNLQYKGFNLGWKQRVNDLPKEFSFWKFLLFSQWVWQVFKSLWAVLFNHSIAILNSELWPRWNLFSRYIFL